MEVTISGRHMEVTEAMEKHVREHIDRLPHFDNHIQHVTVTLGRDSHSQHVEVIAKCHKTTLVANARGHDVYKSIEEAFAKLERQVARSHDKLVRKHSREAQQASEQNRKPDQWREESQ